MTHKLEKGPEGFLRMFRLLSAAKDQAKALGLQDLTHFTDMTLLQLVLDWENLEPDALSDAEFFNILREKEAEAGEADRSRIKLLRGQ